MLSRRDLLKAGSALAVTPSMPNWLRSNGSFSFAYFSDTHVTLGRNIEENRAMLAEMVQQPFAFAINGGDVTDYGWTAEYENYWGLIKDLPFKVRHIAGNHDVRWSPLGPKAYIAGTRDPMYQKFDHNGIHFVLLDSTVPLSHWGHYESEMLRWLEADLKEIGRDVPVFIATHHWVGREGVMIDNEGALLKIMEPYNVKILLTGHGHSDLLWTIDGTAATMNKGLYQGSWQRVDVDREKGEVRLTRTAGAIDARRRPSKLLLTIPLAPSREKRAVYALPATLRAGSALPPTPDGFVEGRWDDGKFKPMSDALNTAGLVGGTHRLVLRREQEYFDAGETRIDGDSGILRKRWSKKLSGGVMSHLLLDGGVLFVSTMDGAVTALEASSGETLWTVKTRGYCHSSPALVNDMIVVGSADGNVYAMDRGTGKPRWRTPTGGPVYASAAFAKGVICIGSGDGSVYGIDPNTGAKRWRFDLPPSNTAFVQSPAATDGERFFLGAWDKFLYALDAQTGKFLWKGDCVGNRSWAYSPAIGGPVVGNGRVIVPANGNNLVCFDTVTGRELWNVTAPGDKFGYSSPFLEGDRITIGCLGDNGEARCVSAQDGSILWTVKTGSVIYDAGPVVVDNRVAIIGSVSGLVTACDASDGKILGQYRMPTGHLLATPAAGPGCVYVASYSDVVTRFDLA